MPTGVPFSSTPPFSGAPPFSRSSPFGNVLLNRLKDLVYSLGGHIFAPGTETYADRLNITGAESALDSQVGYVGNAAGANYAYQDTLADTPKLRAGGLLEFDGSTDHLITDITTPSSGYMLSVFRQDEAIGSYNSIIGVSSTLGGLLLEVTNTGTVSFYRRDGSGAAPVVTTSSISPGVLYIADASWATTGAKCRINGASEGISAVTKDPASSQILTIGCKNTNTTIGSVTGATFMQGAFGIQIIIPNVTLPTSTEQRIRQLVGQIYGVSTL